MQSLEMLESEHHLVTALSVESWPGVLQMVQKHIRGWKIGLEAEMGFPEGEAYSLPMTSEIPMLTSETSNMGMLLLSAEESKKNIFQGTLDEKDKPVLMGTGLDEKARKELREKMISLRDQSRKLRPTHVKTVLL